MVREKEGAEKSFWLDRRVLVTGASGFLGGWLVRSLLEAGADLVCPVRDWVPASQLIRSGLAEKINLVRGDITAPGLIERTLGEYEVQTVFHLAAQTIVPIANRNPVSTFESNIKGTWCLLEACRRSPLVEQVVLASSDKAYGEQVSLPYVETMTLKGDYPYDVSKTCADLLAQSYYTSYGLPVAITRCANFFGGGDLNWNRLVPGTIRAVLREEAPIIRSDGQFVRDYLYIEDGASAYMLLAEKMAENPRLYGEAFNISNEVQLSVLELVSLILKVTGSTLEPEVRAEAVNEIRHQYLSVEKARRLLGWAPRFNIEEALGFTVEWYRGFLESAP